MSPADRYRALAAQLRARAARELSPVMRAQWANLSQCYVRLAEQADHNSPGHFFSKFDVVAAPSAGSCPEEIARLGRVELCRVGGPGRRPP